VRGVPRAVGAAVLAAVLALAVAGPYLRRSDAAYGNPLGSALQRDTISMQRHDPASVLVNALRIGQTALQTPSSRVNAAAAHAIERLARLLGVDAQDPKTTFANSRFPVQTWQPDEDKAAYPVAGLLVLAAAGVLLAGRRRALRLRLYAGLFWLALVLYAGTVRWQPWGNRLILFLLVLGAPLAGLLLDPLLRWRGRRAPVAALATVALVLGGCAGWLAVGYGWPRRLIGPGSVFTVSDRQARFARRPQWLAGYEWAAGAVRTTHPRRVGLVQGYDTWEYPWWLLLPGADIVSLRSLEP